MWRHLRQLTDVVRSFTAAPKLFSHLLIKLPFRLKAEQFCNDYRDLSVLQTGTEPSQPNPLRKYFDGHVEGHGIWKWEHYFEIYHRYFAKFVDRPVNVAEIGIYSGGSLDMWLAYFGSQCRVYGIDIEPACKCYESNRISVFIGDQANRRFWQNFREAAPVIDILIDDGGHTPEQQRISLEEMLPYMRNGGVYLCEDVHGDKNDFAAYATSLVDHLNKNGELNGVQRSIHSIHFHPYCVVIEKHSCSPQRFVAPKHGTQWQPFLD